MINTGTNLNNLCALFSSDQSFGDIHFVTVFPCERKSSPLSRPTVSFGIKSMTEERTGNVYDSSEPPVLLYNRKIAVRIGLDIFVPQSMGGIDCYSVFDRVGNKMLEGNFSVSYTAAGCGEIKYSRDTGAFVLPAFIDIEQFEIKS